MTNVLIWGLGVDFVRQEKELYNMVRIYALNVYLTAKEAPRYTRGGHSYL